MAFWIPLAMAGAGMLKGMKNKKDKAAQDKFRKEALKWAPWTGMSDPGRLDVQGPMGEAMKWGAGGLMMGQMAGGGGGGGLFGGASSAGTAGAEAAGPVGAGTMAEGKIFQPHQPDTGVIHGPMPASGMQRMPADTGVTHGPLPPTEAQLRAQGQWGQMAKGSAGAMNPMQGGAMGGNMHPMMKWMMMQQMMKQMS